MAEIFSYIKPLSNLTGIAKPDGSFKLFPEQLSSLNFDGVATKKQIKTKVSDLKSGQTVLVSDASYNSSSAFITKIEPRAGFINDDANQPTTKYYIYYLSEFSMEQPFTYNATYGDSYSADTELYVLRDDVDNFVLGNDGWTLTNNGNAIFSNIFARGTIEATSGKIDGNLEVGTNPLGGSLVTIGSDLFEGKTFESISEKHSGILLDANNYLLSYPAITQLPVTSIVATNSSVSGSLYSATFTIPLGSGEVNTLQVGDFIKLSGFTHANTTALNTTHQVSAVTETTFTIPVSYNINLTSPVTINVSVTSFALIKTYNLTSMALSSTSDTVDTSTVKIYLSDSDYFIVNTDITLTSFLGDLLPLNGIFRIVDKGSGYISIYSKRIPAGTYTSSLGSIVLYSKVQKFKVGDNFNFMAFSSETGSLKLTGTINANSGNFTNQVYVGQAATTFYVFRKKLVSNVATLSTTEAHSFSVGDIVTIEGVDATFNGTYPVKATPTALTFTYDKTASPVTEIDLVEYGYVSSDSSVDGTIKVGVAATGITIDGTGDPTTSAIYSGEGNYKNIDTPFFIDASGRFSIADKLFFEGGNLTVSGTVTANAFAIDQYNYWNTTGNEGDFRVGNADTYMFWNKTGTSTGTLEVKGTILATAGIFSGNIQTTGKIYSGTLDPGGLLTSGIEVASTGIKGIINGITAFNLPADGVTAPTITNFDILNAKITGSGANAYLIAGTVSDNITVRGDRTGVDATGAIFNTVSNTPTTYSGGTGFYFNESGNFRFGTPTKYIRWDGTNLDITGDVRIGATPASTVVSNASAGVAKPDVYRQASAPSSLVVGPSTATTAYQTITYGTGNRNFGNISNIGSFVVGNRVRAVNGSDSNLWLEGSLTAIVNVGPSLWYFTINVDSFSGTGSEASSWNMRLVTSGVAINSGSVWYDTDDNNKTYVYNGTTWVATETNAAGVGLGNVSDLTPQNQAQTGLIAGTTITGGGITLSSGGNIKGGQTAFNTGSGFFLGYESSQYMFSIGNSAGSNLTWDGSNLNIQGSGTKTLKMSVGTTDATNYFSIVNTGSTPTYGNTNTPFFVNAEGKFSLGSALTWDGTTLTIAGSSGGGIQPGNGVSVNASNQITTISGTGGITISSSGTSGARVQLDSGGLKAYNSGGTNTVAINNDGSASFTGVVTATSGSFSDITATGRLIANSSTEIGNNIRGSANYSGIAINNASWNNAWIRRSDGSFYFKAGSESGSPYIQLDTTGTSAIVFPNFSVNSAGTVSVTGAINATSGSFSGFVSTASGARFGTNVSSTNDGLWLNSNNYFLVNGSTALFRAGTSTNFLQMNSSDASTRLQVDTTNSTYAVEIGGSVRVNGSNAFIYGDLIGNASTAQSAASLGTGTAVYTSGQFLRSDASDSWAASTLTFTPTDATNGIIFDAGFSDTTGDPVITAGGTAHAYGRLGRTANRWYQVNTSNLFVVTTRVTSDAREKTSIENSDLGLDFINMLRPVKYKMINGNKKQFDEEGNLIEDLPGTRWHYGLIAQELKEVLDASNLDAAMWAVDGFETDPNGSQSISYDHIIAPLIKSVQQLSETIEILENRLAALES